LAGGSALTVSYDSGPSSLGGVTDVIVGNATGTVPTGWGSGSSSFTLSSTVSFTAPTTPGTYQLVIHYVATTYTCATTITTCLSAGTGDPFIINLTVANPTVTNATPSVSFTTAATTSNEGSPVDYAFDITDPDADQTWTYPGGSPDCDGGAISNQAIDNALKTGSFTCTFADGPSNHNVTVQVTDSAGADSDEATIGATVDNVDPVVSTPSLDLTSINCRTGVRLSPISFSDAGLIDNPWAVDIDWGDGDHTTYDASAQGAQPDATHTYNAPSTYTPTVTVTDKDGGSDMATSSNSVVVAQVYTTDFLPPFDDSNPSKLIVNTMKNGRTVPVKTTIYDVCAQSYVSSPSVVTIRTNKVSAPTTAPNPDAVENYADAGASSANTNLFRWTSDSTVAGGGFWIYNLDSKALNMITNSYYRIDITVDGNQATKTDWAILQPVK
jgi:hypothetical protein